MSSVTPAMRWLRTSRPGHVILLAGLVAGWLLLYRINESLWEAVLFGWLGLDPEQRLSETLRFFFYDSIKIALLL
ncbi:MAG: permease, partial [Prochlorococcaceae cyanobacterium]